MRLIILAAIAFALAGCASPEVDGETAEATHVVKVRGSDGVFAFEPATLTISPGDTVRWENVNPTYHTITSGKGGQPDGKFNGQVATQGATFEHTFDTAGTFDYYCAPHVSLDMVAEIVVA